MNNLKNFSTKAQRVISKHYSDMSKFKIRNSVMKDYGTGEWVIFFDDLDDVENLPKLINELRKSEKERGNDYKTADILSLTGLAKAELLYNTNDPEIGRNTPDDNEVEHYKNAWGLHSKHIKHYILHFIPNDQIHKRKFNYESLIDYKKELSRKDGEEYDVLSLYLNIPMDYPTGYWAF